MFPCHPSGIKISNGQIRSLPRQPLTPDVMCLVACDYELVQQEKHEEREREREGGSQRLPFSVLVMYRLPSQPLEKLGTHSLGGGFRDHE